MLIFDDWSDQMTEQNLDLTSIFNAVTQTMAANQQELNQADEFNHNHGDNMVQTFKTITKALEQKQSSTDSAALAYAARQVGKNAASSSSRQYAENLSRAAAQFKGRPVDEQGALQLLQTLIGGQQPAAQSSVSSDPLGGLLGGLMGGQTSSPQPSSSDPLGGLLGGLMGGSGAPSGGGSSGLQDGIGMDDLLTAGMAFFQAKQSGKDNMQALVQAFMAASGMGGSVHRNQSTQLVVQSFLQAISAGKGS